MKKVNDDESKKVNKKNKNKRKKNEKSLKETVSKKLNKNAHFKVYELIFFGFVIIIVSALLGAFIFQSFFESDKGNKSNVAKNELEEFEEVYGIINSSYYKDVDKKELIDGAINGMLSSLNDPHTSYFNKAETDNFNEVMNGSYEGVGVEISTDSDGNIFVFSVFKNSPAAEVGIKFKDIIIEVNGKSTKGLTTTDVVSLIKDKDKPVANIKVSRDGKELTFDVTKREVIIESVESKIYNKNGKSIGYILINNFANNTYDQFREKLEALEEKEISGLVIDVRGNSGGYLHSVTNMLDMFLYKGTVIYQIADKNSTTKYEAQTNESRNYPIAVLTNKASASASEILAIGLKESYGASVVGTSTYGKGTVQTTKDLSSGGMIKYTIQKWLSPNGNWVNDVGVEPTNKIELSKEYEENPTEENDNQLIEALNIVSNK